VFRSRVREVVYPQAEHQRLAGAVAAEWASPPPAVPFAALVRGVATHDRGYGELDTDGIGELETERWLAIQRRGLSPEGDPIVDLVVAMHSLRLVSGTSMRVSGDVVREFERVRDERLASAGVDREVAAAVDRITELCDRLAFSFCFEEGDAGTVGELDFTLDADGNASISPWPLRTPELRTTVVGYEAGGYPERLVPVEREFRLAQAGVAGCAGGSGQPA
jgi:hypothetical protein